MEACPDWHFALCSINLLLAEKLPAFVDQHYGSMVQTWRILQWLSEEEGAFQLQLQPLRAIHFAPEVQQAQTPATDPRYPLLLAALAFAILLMQDIAIVPLLALVPLLAGGDPTLGEEDPLDATRIGFSIAPRKRAPLAA